MAESKTKVDSLEYKLIRKVDASPETLVLQFEPVGGAVRFKPGGSVMIRGVDEAGKKYAPRAFSVASAPSNPLLKLIAIKMPKHGNNVHISHFVDAKEGDKFLLSAPQIKFPAVNFGPGNNIDPEKDRFLIIAGGTGIAPFRSILDEIATMTKRLDVALIWSVRTPSEIIEREQVTRLEQDGIAKVIITVTRPVEGDGWRGKTGHIVDDTLAAVPDIQKRTALICGSLSFATQLTDLLRKYGVDVQKDNVDAWG
jgi:ferredoxin-NADP reductase